MYDIYIYNMSILFMWELVKGESPQLGLLMLKKH